MRTMRYTRRVDTGASILGGSGSYMELSTEAVVGSEEEAEEAGAESERFFDAFLTGIETEMRSSGDSK
jgi:hypothetical protein